MRADTAESTPRNVRQCRGCGETLTVETARTYQGRWVGACRACENAERIARAKGRAVQS